MSTLSAEGRGNLAPFSFFQGVTANPPTLLFVVANTRDGGRKDTFRNVEATREFVVNLVPFALADAMNATSASLPYGESEFERFGIASAPSARVRPPRVAASPVALECTLDRIVTVDSTANEVATAACISGISDPAPYGPWTDDMKAVLGEKQEMTFTFYYQ